MPPDFRAFSKIPRLYRAIIVTEKIDGTNGCIYVPEHLSEPLVAGSRHRWLTLDADNFGFAAWVQAHEAELRGLGPGIHFGEFWGKGIQRGYGLTERRFSLFNVSRWNDPAVRPACCHVVPTLSEGVYSESLIKWGLEILRLDGSQAAPGFLKPEGIVVYYVAGGYSFKVTLEGDGEQKSAAKAQ